MSVNRKMLYWLWAISLFVAFGAGMNVAHELDKFMCARAHGIDFTRDSWVDEKGAIHVQSLEDLPIKFKTADDVN